MARSMTAGERSGFTLVEVLVAGTIAAMLAGAMAYLLSDVLHLASVARATSDLHRESRHAVSLIRSDVIGASRILSAGGDSLMLMALNGDTVSYAQDPMAPDTLRRRQSALSGAVAAGLDSAQFIVHTVSRIKTVEELTPIPYEVLHVSFEPGDWDGWASSRSCFVYDTQAFRINNTAWCGEEFWESPSCYGFSRAAVRVAAKDRIPPDVDMIVEIYQASAGSGSSPGRLISRGRIDRNALTAGYAWHTAHLAPVAHDSFFPEGCYWLVARPDGQGSSSYAGHLQWQRIGACLGNSYPQNGICFRESYDGGTSWLAGSTTKEAFFRVYSLQMVERLTEVNRTFTDTIGVSYTLAFSRGDEEARRVGFVALRNR